MRSYCESQCPVFAAGPEGGPEGGPKGGSECGPAHAAVRASGPDHEIEIKMRATPQILKRIAGSKLVREAADGPVQVKKLETRYFDTPDHTLRALGLTLRLRRKGKRWQQTLKTNVHDPVCLFHRHEWTTPVAKPKPDLTVIPEEAWPENKCPVTAESLRQMFKTEITRRRVDLTWPDPHTGTATVELCLDQGRVLAGKAAQDICEVELELVQGTQAALFLLEERFRSAFDLECETDSKSARGFALISPKAKLRAA